MKQKTSKKYPIWTIGHSNRTFQELADLLGKNEVTVLVDVRTIPRSRYNPQFNKERLEKKLKTEKIDYRWMPGLGGLRRAKPDSINSAWQNASFRGFADYMQTPEFVSQLQPLLHLAKKKRTAIMCAEAVPWRCHRSLISDALFVRKFEVKHILGPKSIKIHCLIPWAKAKGVKVWYPGLL